MSCEHKCHKVGLNPWVEECPICGCVNPKFDPKIPAPTTWEELVNWDAEPLPREEPGK